MRYKIYSEFEGRAAAGYRETAEGAADWLIDRGAAGVVIWDEQTSDRVYLPWQFEELLASNAHRSGPFHSGSAPFTAGCVAKRRAATSQFSWL